MPGGPFPDNLPTDRNGHPFFELRPARPTVFGNDIFSASPTIRLGMFAEMLAASSFQIGERSKKRRIIGRQPDEDRSPIFKLPQH